jgi:hypothetical protein
MTFYRLPSVQYNTLRLRGKRRFLEMETLSYGFVNIALPVFLEI